MLFCKLTGFVKQKFHKGQIFSFEKLFFFATDRKYFGGGLTCPLSLLCLLLVSLSLAKLISSDLFQYFPSAGEEGCRHSNVSESNSNVILHV